MQQYTLADLAYDYGALEPYYSAEMLELHDGPTEAASRSATPAER
jgi:hypothetical protein